MKVNRGLVLFAILITLPYLRGQSYQFPPPAPFSGAAFLNPYQSATATWQRANLHAHARAWGGFTNGRQSAQEVVDRYRGLGYSIAGVSDYQHITAHDGVPTIPEYEHGYNLAKRHQLAIGARGVEWLDFPLWQSVSNQQLVIDRVKAQAELVALAHPSHDAYSADDLRRLTGYDLMEVVNGPFVMEDAWDAALSSGRLVWAIADDDTHDLTDPQRTGVAWNMIGAPTTSTSDVVSALKAGRSYAVMKTVEGPTPLDPPIPGVAFADGTLTVQLAAKPSTFVFIGQNGTVRKLVNDTTSASYTFAPDDTYIRTVVRSGETAAFLNPVVRYDGHQVQALTATIDSASTWTMRAGYVLASAAALALVFRRRTSKVPSPVLQEISRADRKRA
jgi:hypothetical protein